jgi:hypothetical protein
VILVGVSAAFATAHGFGLLAAGSGYLEEGLQILAIATVFAAPILILLGSSKTAALFEPSASSVPVAAQKRRWWTLSAQWFGAALVCVFTIGLVRLCFVGPLVEVVWAAVLFTRSLLGV